MSDLRSLADSQKTENLRLRRELHEALEQQTATSEVLKVVSSFTGDLEPVFATILENAVRICTAKFGNIYRWEDDALHLVATHNTPPALAEYRRRSPVRPNPTTGIGRMVATKKVIHIADAAAEPGYFEQRDPVSVSAVEFGGIRSLLLVPMLRENELVGSLTLYRKEVRPFTEKQTALVMNFASQAVIAIENARLLNELRQHTDKLNRSLAKLQRERDNRLMNLEAMAASISHEVRQPLTAITTNGMAAKRFLGRTPPDLEEVRLALDRMVTAGHRASEVFDNIRALFGSSAAQGQAPIDVNETILGALRDLRKEFEDHAITTRTELMPKLPLVMGHGGQLQEVILNLARNAIEAMDAIKDGHRVLQVKTKHDDRNSITVAVEDTGPGIDPEKSAGIFDMFVTTKAKGMGLGLAICRMIIERHGGQLTASSDGKRGALFQFVLPIQSTTGSSTAPS